MNNTIIDQLQNRCHLETSALRLERRSKEIKEALKQARFQKRACDEKLLLYDGSFRKFLDRLSGKQEDRQEALCWELNRAEANLNNLLREQDDLDRQLSETRKQLLTLPSMDILREEAEKDPQARKEFFRLDALFCMETLQPMLEENHAALFELRRLMRGDRAGEILSIAEQQEIYAAPERRGEACKPLLLRLKADLTGLGVSFEPGGYFESPTAFIVSAAAAHNRLDRVNQALDQVEDTQRQLRRLKEQLEE